MASVVRQPVTRRALNEREVKIYRGALGVAVVAGLFSLAVSLTLIVERLRVQSHDPLQARELDRLKQTLGSQPQNEELKERIRDDDLALRERFFRSLSLRQSGAWLLLGGVAVFLVAAGQAAAYRKLLPMPGLQPDTAAEAARQGRWARWAVAATGLVVATGLLTLALNVGTALPSSPEELEKLTGHGGKEAATDWASLDEMRKNWPRFRGADGDGICQETGLPVNWDVEGGAGILWKVPVPAPGFSSPIVWEDRVFFAGGNAAKREVFCFQLQTGELLWRQAVENVPGSPAKAPEVPEFTGYAASTMATDGRRVYAVFPNGDLVAFDFRGSRVWAKSLGVPENPYGHASSLAMWEGKLLVQFDQAESDPPQSKLLALEGGTGAVVWQRPRPVPSSWSTPIVIEASGQAQIITLGVPWVIAYAANDGAEIWRAESLSGEVTPSPVFAGGVLYVISPTEKLLAIRPDGRGDVTQTHVRWEVEEYMSDIPSPVSNGQLVFTVTTQGLLNCFDAEKGERLWEHDCELEVHASLSLAADRLYVVSKEGPVLVVAAAREFQALARNEMGEEISASPAFAGKRIILRGVEHLFCVGEPAGEGTNAL